MYIHIFILNAALRIIMSEMSLSLVILERIKSGKKSVFFLPKNLSLINDKMFYFITYR